MTAHPTQGRIHGDADRGTGWPPEGGTAPHRRAGPPAGWTAGAHPPTTRPPTPRSAEGRPGDLRDGEETAPDPRQIGLLLRRAHQRHSAVLAERLRPFNLTPAQLAVLNRLRDIGRLSQNHLGRLTAMDPATVQGVVRRLMGRGLVQRGPDPADRRRIILSLTPSGRELTERADSYASEVVAETVAPLAATDIHRLIDLLRRLS